MPTQGLIKWRSPRAYLKSGAYPESVARVPRLVGPPLQPASKLCFSCSNDAANYSTEWSVR